MATAMLYRNVRKIITVPGSGMAARVLHGEIKVAIPPDAV
jgi:hypothetical protein